MANASWMKYATTCNVKIVEKLRWFYAKMGSRFSKMCIYITQFQSNRIWLQYSQFAKGWKFHLIECYLDVEPTQLALKTVSPHYTCHLVDHWHLLHEFRIGLALIFGLEIQSNIWHPVWIQFVSISLTLSLYSGLIDVSKTVHLTFLMLWFNHASLWANFWRISIQW